MSNKVKNIFGEICQIQSSLLKLFESNHNNPDDNQSIEYDYIRDQIIDKYEDYLIEASSYLQKIVFDKKNVFSNNINKLKRFVQDNQTKHEKKENSADFEDIEKSLKEFYHSMSDVSMEIKFVITGKAYAPTHQRDIDSLNSLMNRIVDISRYFDEHNSIKNSCPSRDVHVNGKNLSCSCVSIDGMIFIYKQFDAFLKSYKLFGCVRKDTPYSLVDPDESYDSYFPTLNNLASALESDIYKLINNKNNTVSKQLSSDRYLEIQYLERSSLDNASLTNTKPLKIKYHASETVVQKQFQCEENCFELFEKRRSPYLEYSQVPDPNGYFTKDTTTNTPSTSARKKRNTTIEESEDNNNGSNGSNSKMPKKRSKRNSSKDLNDDDEIMNTDEDEDQSDAIKINSDKKKKCAPRKIPNKRSSNKRNNEEDIDIDEDIKDSNSIINIPINIIKNLAILEVTSFESDYITNLSEFDTEKVASILKSTAKDMTELTKATDKLNKETIVAYIFSHFDIERVKSESFTAFFNELMTSLLNTYNEIVVSHNIEMYLGSKLLNLFRKLKRFLNNLGFQLVTTMVEESTERQNIINQINQSKKTYENDAFKFDESSRSFQYLRNLMALLKKSEPSYNNDRIESIVNVFVFNLEDNNRRCTLLKDELENITGTSEVSAEKSLQLEILREEYLKKKEERKRKKKSEPDIELDMEKKDKDYSKVVEKTSEENLIKISIPNGTELKPGVNTINFIVPENNDSVVNISDFYSSINAGSSLWSSPILGSNSTSKSIPYLCDQDVTTDLSKEINSCDTSQSSSLQLKSILSNTYILVLTTNEDRELGTLLTINLENINNYEVLRNIIAYLMDENSSKNDKALDELLKHDCIIYEYYKFSLRDLYCNNSDSIKYNSLYRNVNPDDNIALQRAVFRVSKALEKSKATASDIYELYVSNIFGSVETPTDILNFKIFYKTLLVSLERVIGDEDDFTAFFLSIKEKIIFDENAVRHKLTILQSNVNNIIAKLDTSSSSISSEVDSTNATEDLILDLEMIPFIVNLLIWSSADASIKELQISVFQKYDNEFDSKTIDIIQFLKSLTSKENEEVSLFLYKLILSTKSVLTDTGIIKNGEFNYKEINESLVPSSYVLHIPGENHNSSHCTLFLEPSLVKVSRTLDKQKTSLKLDKNRETIDHQSEVSSLDNMITKIREELKKAIIKKGSIVQTNIIKDVCFPTDKMSFNELENNLSNYLQSQTGLITFIDEKVDEICKELIRIDDLSDTETIILTIVSNESSDCYNKAALVTEKIDIRRYDMETLLDQSKTANSIPKACLNSLISLINLRSYVRDDMKMFCLDTDLVELIIHFENLQSLQTSILKNKGDTINSVINLRIRIASLIIVPVVSETKTDMIVEPEMIMLFIPKEKRAFVVTPFSASLDLSQSQSIICKKMITFINHKLSATDYFSIDIDNDWKIDQIPVGESEHQITYFGDYAIAYILSIGISQNGFLDLASKFCGDKHEKKNLIGLMSGNWSDYKKLIAVLLYFGKL